MFSTRFLFSLTSPLLDWLAPTCCLGCDQPVPARRLFCDLCTVTLQPLEEPLCGICGAPGWTRACEECRRSPPPYERARSGYLFGGQLAHALRRYKYGRQLHLASPMGALLAPLIAAQCQSIDCLVAVPVSRRGLRQRGFNQVVEMVRAARRVDGALPPLQPRALERTRDLPAQASVSPSVRRRLSASAFRVVRDRSLRNKSVLLVDDVMTTGATARACAKALVRGGAARVGVVTLARAPSRFI